MDPRRRTDDVTEPCDGIDVRAMTASDLGVVEPWFDDPQLRRWLGDRTWPRQVLRLAERSPSRLVFVAALEGRVTGLIDVDRHLDGRAAIALAVEPCRRRRGTARALLRALESRSSELGITELFGGVEQGNRAALALMRSAGFEMVQQTVDATGFTSFARRTDGAPLRRPWTPPAE